MSEVTHFFRREIPATMEWVGRFRLTAGVIVCYVLFRGLTRAVGVPSVPEMSGSLMNQPMPFVAMGAVAAGMLIGTLAGKFIVGDLLIGPDRLFEGGLVAALLGLGGVAFSVGPVRYALFYIDDPKVFALLAVELLLLYFLVAVCWAGLQWSALPSAPSEREPLATNLSATGMHVVVMATCMLFIAQSDATAQGFAAVGISAFLASMAAHLAFPVRSSVWFWISPAIVGVAGYAIAFMNPSGLAIGYPLGSMGALARATPLAYASAGPAGAIFGYWIAYGWQHENE